MKHTTNKYPHLKVVNTAYPVCPNAADQNYFTQKALDVMTGIVSCMGFVTAMVFLVTMA
ncbi:MAG: hypothetical protein IKB09_01480 [Oscillospiraceae bacterium]|nr:hypothetical protein [Oscillospiraceae bacterium]